MSKSNFELRGRVVLLRTDIGVSDLRVVIADQQTQTPSLILRGITDDSGGFCVRLCHDDVASLIVPGGANQNIWTGSGTLYISVYNGDALLTTATQTITMADLARGDLPSLIEVTVDSALQFSVHGRVVNADGSPVTSGVVIVERVDVGGRVQVATETLGNEGLFDLEYDGVAESTPKSTNMAIVVRVLDSAGGSELARTPVIVDPEPRHEVDLLTSELSEYVGQPEYSRVAAAMSAQGASNPTADDLEVLVKRTGMPADQVAMAIQADRIAVAQGIPAAASYALMQAGLPPDVPGQLAQPQDTIRRALQAAIDSNLVEPTAYDVETVVAQYATVKASAILSGSDSRLSDIIQSSGLATATTNLFVTRLAEREADLETLWADLRAGSEFTSAEVDVLEFTMGASELSNGHPDLVVALQAERVAGNIATIADLSAWDESDWSSFVATHGAPTTLPGTQAEREALYAAAINRFVEERFPTQTIARRVERDASASELPTFIDANPDFDFESTIVAQYAEDNPSAFTGFATDVEAELKATQRVYALTPRFHRYSVARALLDAGIESAAQVVHTGKAAFIANFSSTLDGLHDNLSGEEVAKSVYAAAVQKHAFSIATMAQYGASFNTVSIPSIPSKVLDGTEGSGAATLATLFGSLDYCECKHCRSMYGPAAYFVALLSSLEGAGFLDELTSRRADLTGLELSCINTNTTLPYIDVVNEVLEQVSLELQAEGNLDNLQIEARQTSWTAEELRINPEPTAFSAPDGNGGTIYPYDGPAQAVFPWSLPLDVPAVETGAYLDQLGVPRAELLRLFGASALDEAPERLGMTSREFGLIAGTEADVDPQDAWGMAGNAGWVTTLAGNLRTLLDRAGISYEELTKVLALRYVNDEVSPATIAFVNAEPSCALEDREIVSFSEAIADRMHRFLRLSRKLDMDWLELDRLIATVGGGVIDEPFLVTLAGLLEVRQRFGLATDEAAAFYADIGAYPYDEPFDPSPSLYERLFQSRKVFAEPDPAFAIGALGGTIEASHHPTLRAALGVNDAELAVLLAREQNARTLPVLSQMYRVVRLSKSLGISMADYYRAVDLSTNDPSAPFDPFETPVATREFADLVESLVDWGVSFVDLNYLCRHEEVEAYGQELTQEDRDGIFDALVPLFEAVEEALALDGDPVAVVRELAMRARGATEADDLVGILVNAPASGSADTTLIGDDRGTVESFLPPGVGLDAFAGTDWTGGDPEPAAIDARSAWMVGQIRDLLRQQGRADAVVDLLTEVVGLERELVETLATEYVSVDLGGTPTDLVAVLRLETADPQLRDQGLARFLKIAAFVSSLGVEEDELSWYFATPAEAQGMDLASVPLDTVGEPNVFPGWNRVRRGRVNAEAFVDESPLPELVGMTAAERATPIAQATGWDAADVAEALSFWQVPNAGTALEDPGALETVRGVIDATRVAGVNAATLQAWVTSVDAAAMKEAMRARFSESQWPKVIQPISDRLRELRRDALMAYILMNSDFKNETAVYDHFLLDPEMNACMLTSRIKLAISSVQLFIQRALLGLEENVTLPVGFEKDWEWKKNYRVWEANRKVFFYPENWIEPELRVGKTPFFEELEAHLQQGELTEAHVEKGFDDYLAKLHEVANLEVLDLHRTSDAVTGTTIHVLARTRTQPGKYFYRTRVNDSYWTPWEVVEAPVESRQAILRSVGGRLLLFWLEFNEVVEVYEPAVVESGGGVVSGTNLDYSEGVGVFHYRVSWCERSAAGWARPRTADVDPDSHTRVLATPANRQLHFIWGKLEDAGDGLMRLVIDVHCTSEYVGVDGVVARVRYNPCSDQFETVPLLISDSPLGLPGHSNGYSRTFSEGSGGGQRVYLHRLRPSGGGIAEIDIIEHATGNPRLVVPHQNGFVGSPRHDGLYPAVVTSHEHNLYAVPTNGEFRFVTSTALGNGVGAGGLNAYIQSSHDPESELPSAFQGAGGLGDSTELAIATKGTNLFEVVASAQVAPELPPSETVEWKPAWRLDLFHHPYTCQMLSAQRLGGSGELFGSYGPLWRQLGEAVEYTPWDQGGAGTPNLLTRQVVAPFPVEEFEFSAGGAYSVYNWEVFYHSPMLIADLYRREGKFEEADRWYRRIFDPRSGASAAAGPQRFWHVKPLYLEARDQEPDVIQTIFSTEGLDAHPDVVQDFLASIARWVGSPFDPHAIASVRSGTYRWAAVRRYLDNLIEWGDSLFRRDTIESIGEATQLYLLASEILGHKPERMSELNVSVSAYSELGLAGLFGGLAELESFHPSNGGLVPFGALVGNDGPEPPPVWWYFCLPANPQLLEYWDTVADRLFKIRNCQNIEGAERQLALFQPPIDPALLVRARAAGVDFGDAVDGLNASLPGYRYRVLAARSIDLCNDLRTMGGALITAIEKRDAEALARIRSSHEVSVAQRIVRVRELQIEEADTQIVALAASRDMALERREYFASRERAIDSEITQLKKMDDAGRQRGLQESMAEMGTFLGAIPDLSIGIFPPSIGTSFGGSFFSAIFGGIAQGHAAKARKDDLNGSVAGIHASMERRWDEWMHQVELARLELAQIDKQIIAAEIRKAIAEKELENLERQIEQSKEIQAFYQDKFTNKELYDWMIGESSRLYFQAYKLAFDMAKKAERAMQFELETEDTFIEFGYWDSLRKGLMAGERLHLDIKRMESAYLDKDKRELELTKRISLRQVDPQALLELRETGTCDFEIPEVLFDLDHAGHYLRRTRAVRVTIPAVAGPQTSVGATLTLLRDDLRTEPDINAEPRTTYGGTKRIATSHAREDGGMFELSFRDERYLPFEGAGVASRWSLRLPRRELAQFDYDTISDVEIRIDYTARDGGAGFRGDVEGQLQAGLEAALADASQQGLAMVLSAKKDFAVDWERFLRPADGETDLAMEVPITLERFPFVMRGFSPSVESVDVVMVGEGFSDGVGEADISPPGSDAESMDGGATDGFSVAVNSVEVTDQPWGLDLGSAVQITDPDAVEDLWVIVRFSVTLP